MTERLNNLQIQLNTNIIKRLKSHDLYVDHMGSAIIILLALQEARYDLLDEFDDSNRNKRAIILYRQLELRGFIESAEREGKTNYKLTKKAIILLDFIKKEYKVKNQELNIENLEIAKEEIEPVITKESTSGIISWISEYINLFPKQFRDHPRSVVMRMDAFMKEYNYSKETILGATKMYIQEQEDKPEGHQFTRKSIYFIYKGAGTSQTCDLATWCQNYENKDKSSDYDTKFLNMA